eukprot:TRINITY_DN1522_c7_g1_i1.p1 TRINITY_DN1522_c7_g1~~TRINITY_DN1522_c7_g1_i1.p1  ORF type:complete len:212 (+),score=54.92 TRINITY_DN1522_c7_g1_i1:70-705(+)
MKAAAALLTLVASSSAASISWTGIVNDQQWTTANNWYPAQVPGASDDVTIDDSEGKDAVVVMTTPQTVRSLSIGNKVANKATLNVLSALSAGSVTVAENGHAVINSGAASLATGVLSVNGKWSHYAGTFAGNATVNGIADFGMQSAKVFDKATVDIKSTSEIIAAGSLQFQGGSVITGTSSVTASGNNFQCLVADKSTGNKFTAGGFSWVQ